MKRSFCLVLAFLSCFALLFGCSPAEQNPTQTFPGTESESSTEETVQTTTAPVTTQTGEPVETAPEPLPEAEIGEILDEPETVFIAELLSVYVKVNVNGKPIEIAASQPSYEEMLYYAVTETGEEVLYIGPYGAELYVKEQGRDRFQHSSNREKAEKEYTGIREVLSYVGIGAEVLFPGAKFKKTAGMESPFGHAYVYEVLTDGKKTANITVDAETGLFVDLVLAQENTHIVLDDYSFKDVYIPQYKAASLVGNPG